MSTLDELIVNGEELDQELLGSILKPVLRIDRQGLGIRPQAGWRKLSAKAKVGAFLLARKVMVALHLLEDGKVRPADVIKNVGLPAGTVHPALKELYEARPQLVDKDNASRYWVPGWAVHDLADLISGELEARLGQ
jgi:hypothetical protein